MISEVQRARITLKLDELKKEKAALGKKLESQQVFHSAAWEQYGSELCAGEMLNDDRHLAEEILEVERKIVLLQNLDQGLNIAARELALRNQFAEIDHSAKELEKEKAITVRELGMIDFIKSVIGV